jgi:DNA-binding response OmpR family regulator
MPARILVIETDQHIRELIAEILHDEGYEVRVGDRASVTYADIVETDPDLIILDVIPHLAAQSWALVAQLQQRPATQTISLIVSSTVTPTADESPALPSQVALLPKPFALDVLLQTVGESLRVARRHGVSSRLCYRQSDREHGRGDHA